MQTSVGAVVYAESGGHTVTVRVIAVVVVGSGVADQPAGSVGYLKQGLTPSATVETGPSDVRPPTVSLLSSPMGMSPPTASVALMLATTVSPTSRAETSVLTPVRVKVPPSGRAVPVAGKIDGHRTDLGVLVIGSLKTR